MNAACSSLNNYGKAKLYSCAIFDDGVLVRYYKPYRSADGATVGLKDLVSGTILTQAAGNAFTCGGDISENPTWEVEGTRQAGDEMEYLVQADVGSNGTLELTKNGEVVSGTSVWATSNDTVTVSATAVEGKRFMQWQGERGSFAPESYLGDASVTIHPVAPVALTAIWVTPKTRTWTPTTANSDGGYYWATAANWLDETGATGKPVIGDTVIYGTASSTKVCRNISEGNANNPVYVVQYENTKTISMNQGWFALIAGGRGLQYGRNDNSGSNWSGIYCVGDGLVPVNIAYNKEYVMQKGCQLGSKVGYRRVRSPIAGCLMARRSTT